MSTNINAIVSKCYAIEGEDTEVRGCRRILSKILKIVENPVLIIMLQLNKVLTNVLKYTTMLIRIINFIF